MRKINEKRQRKSLHSHSKYDIIPKSALSKGYPVYAIIETDNMAKNVELVDSWQWSASHVLVKLQDGTKVRVPMNSVKMIKC